MDYTKLSMPELQQAKLRARCNRDTARYYAIKGEIELRNARASGDFTEVYGFVGASRNRFY